MSDVGSKDVVAKAVREVCGSAAFVLEGLDALDVRENEFQVSDACGEVTFISVDGEVVVESRFSWCSGSSRRISNLYCSKIVVGEIFV